jgi:OOP family OmpA-OmpF porin
MSQFDDIVDAAAARFGLGPKAGALLRELEQLMIGSPGGLGAFIQKFQSAGLSREVNSWLGNPEAPALTPLQVDSALGSSTIDRIAQKVGLSSATTAAALGYLTPKLMGRLTPDGEIPNVLPSFTHASGSYAPASAPAPYTVTEPSTASAARWILPLLALLAAGGLGWYAFEHWAPGTTRTASNTESGTSVPARLAITNNNGVVTVSGAVRDQASRTAILDALRNAFGNNFKGDIAVDPNAASSPWLANLPSALAQLKTPGVQALFEGSNVNLGGSIPESERDRILASLKSLFGAAGLTFAGTQAANSALDQMSSAMSDADRKISAALSALGSRFQTNDLLDILNKSIIHFPTGSAEVPPASRALLQQAAALFKQLPPGTVVEIGGHTDNTGDPNANLSLSQARADAVRNVLVQAGVNPAMLVAKGFGDAQPVASNDTAEGRLQNRRIAYQVQKSGTVGVGR